MSLEYKVLAQELITYTDVPFTTIGSGGTGVGGYGYYGGNIGDQGTSGLVEEFLPVTIYTVPAGKETVVSAIFIANNDTASTLYDLAIVPSGEELSLKHHLRFDSQIASSDFDLINTKITMSAGDSLVVYPSTVNKVTVTAFGIEK